VVVTFRVQDVDAAVEKLLAARVEVPRTHGAEWGAAAHLLDSEGNELQVYEAP
jgi:predicted enzyme related to lactoylglutathione lyase